jgi:predicted permease
MEELRHDIRTAIRRLARQPAFSGIAVLTLALGIGANTAIFSVLKAVILQPLPYSDPQRLVIVWNVGSKPGSITWLSDREVLAYQQDMTSFERVSGFIQAEGNITGGEEPLRVRLAAVTPELFDTLGAGAIVGRTFNGNEGKPGGNNNVVLLSHGLWMRRFGGDPALIGTKIQVQGVGRTVIGVMAANFRLPIDYRNDRPTEAFLPYPIDPANLSHWGDRSAIVVARLRRDTKASAATNELALLWQRWVAAGYVHDQPGNPFSRAAVPIGEFITGSVRLPMLILAGTVGFVLLIAVANVANLLLAKADVRARDIAVQSALGAARGRLVRELMTESLVLAACGGALGTAVAWCILRGIAGMGTAHVPRLSDASIDSLVLAITAILSIIAGVAFGLAPALQISRPDLASALHDGGRGCTASHGRVAARRALVVLQFALSVVLVLGAALLARSLIAVNRIDLGFRTDDVLTAQLQLPARDYPQRERVVGFYRDLLDRLRQTPGVRNAGAIRILPLARTIGNWSITIEGRPHVPAEDPNGDFQWVTPGYFEAMGIKILRGRFLTYADDENAPMVVVINDAMARKYWPGEDALGKRFHLSTDDRPWLTVVGIVGEVRHNAVIEDPRTEMYLPHAQVSRETGNTPRAMTIVVRSDTEPLLLVPSLRATVRALDPNIPLAEVRTLKRVAEESVSDRRFTTALLAAFATLALGLAAIGIYGTVSLMVSERSHEIGIRMALGAGRGTIVGMVIRQGLTMSAAGVGLGLAGATFLTRLLEQMLYGISRLDTATFVGVPALLSVVALVACVNPALRAARLDPIETLRR